NWHNRGQISLMSRWRQGQFRLSPVVPQPDMPQINAMNADATHLNCLTEAVLGALAEVSNTLGAGFREKVAEGPFAVWPADRRPKENRPSGRRLVNRAAGIPPAEWCRVFAFSPALRLAPGV